MHSLGITLEQLRALEALARTGTFAAAAAALGRGHTSVLYLIRTLEDALGFAVLDRSRLPHDAVGRTAPGAGGRREVLAAEAELHAAIHELRAGWEPTLRVVFDGIVPIEPLLRAVGSSRASGCRPGSTCAPSSWPASRTRSRARRRT
jgi:DNA-binding transcriptional LysR family regulator